MHLTDNSTRAVLDEQPALHQQSRRTAVKQQATCTKQQNMHASASSPHSSAQLILHITWLPAAHHVGLSRQISPESASANKDEQETRTEVGGVFMRRME